MKDEKCYSRFRLVVIAATSLALFGCAVPSPHVTNLSQQAELTGAHVIADMPGPSDMAPTPAEETRYPDDDYALSPY